MTSIINKTSDIVNNLFCFIYDKRCNVIRAFIFLRKIVLISKTRKRLMTK